MIEAVRTYVDEALAQLKRQGLMRTVNHRGFPPEMVESISPSQNDWVDWKPIPSTVSDADLDALEDEIGLTYPPPYRDFLKYLHFVNLTETGVRFADHSLGEWKECLRGMYGCGWPRIRNHVLDKGLIPFGHECFADAGLVCFDIRNRNTAEDCPVVCWDYDWMGTDREIWPMFSSSLKMFECLTFVARNDIGFVHHLEEYDDPSEFPTKRKLLSGFLALDPQGAGGAAREYWTGWGVTPDTSAIEI